MKLVILYLTVILALLKPSVIFFPHVPGGMVKVIELA